MMNEFTEVLNHSCHKLDTISKELEGVIAQISEENGEMQENTLENSSIKGKLLNINNCLRGVAATLHSLERDCRYYQDM